MKLVRYLCTSLVVISLLSLSAAGAQADQTGEALAIYKQGRKHYAAGDYRAAIEEFEASYALSKHKNNLYFLGECHRRLGNLRRSHDFYDRYASALPEAKERAFRRKMDKLRFGKPCMISIATTPGGAMVVVDGKKRGRTPKTGEPMRLEIPGGEHLVLIGMNGFLPVRSKLKAEFGEPQALSFALKAIIKPAKYAVTASVEGAKLFLDDQELGAVPMTLELQPGEHVIRVTREGHKPAERQVLARSGERRSMAFELTPLGGAGASGATDRLTPEAAAEGAVVTKQPDGRRRNIAWAVVGGTAGGLAVGGLILGLVYNKKYNDEYDDSPDAPTYGNIAVTGYVLAGCFAAASVAGFLLYALSGSSPKKEDDDGEKAAFFVGPPQRGSGLIVGGGLSF